MQYTHPHRRFNALTGEWVFVSAHRTQRPWQGHIESVAPPARASYDPQCYLCPGNLRANGERNPAYTATYVFTNDFPAFVPEVPEVNLDGGPLLHAHGHAGTCRVVCYSPRHDLQLAQMPLPAVRSVIDTWADEVAGLGERWRWVQVFENKGELMGASNPHPHGQIWAGDFLPNEPARELAQQERWLASRAAPLLLEYAALECRAGERLVVENAEWLAVVPWWAAWPFETLLLPRRPVARLPELTGPERASLAELLQQLLLKYDGLFEVSFPYSFGWHGAPSGGGPVAEAAPGVWQLHAHFYPPLLRSASMRKFMVGYELLAEVQRDLTPEAAAERLRSVRTSPGKLSQADADL